ncbi:MAG: hypothetical protein ACREH8_12630 [Opitutaceae bacterium]
MSSSGLPKNPDGISIVPTLRGKPQRKHDFLYWEMPVANGRYTQAIRMGDWKAVKSRPAAAFELYNSRTTRRRRPTWPTGIPT